ncbi:MAG TPA: DedA family protein [Waddliaceae bacterium]
MDQISDTFLIWLHLYGSFALFGLLALGIIALPIPDETLMVAAGVLIDRGDLHIMPTLLAAYMGSIFGISVSYLLGLTVGSYLIKRYGNQIGLTEARMQRVHLWFEKYGKWTLFFGYFVPSLRHLTGVSAGISGLKYPEFALFAYAGAIVWASTFLSIGYFIGQNWIFFFEYIEEYSEIAISIFVFLVIAFLFYLKLTSRK